jgi:enolase
VKISNISGREILDSNGIPTVECVLVLDGGQSVKASVPSGASTGKYEAIELRDGDKDRFLGKGVLTAIQNLEQKIAPALIGKKPDLVEMDKLIIDIDGTENKSNLGANATLAASIAVARAQAIDLNTQTYELINKIFQIGPTSFPQCMFNVLNGGVHADNGVAFQEFMIMPQKQGSMQNTMHTAACIYQTLKNILKKDGYGIGVGFEGGFAPIIKGSKNKENIMLDYLHKAVEQSGFCSNEIAFCLDVAASQFYDAEKSIYLIEGQELSSTQMVDLYQNLVENYPIVSIEDGMAEDDWYGWQLLTEKLGNKVQIVGDDLFVTNINRIEKGIKLGVANAVLIKPNQIGTVSQTVEAIKLCRSNGYKTVVSHRSGETCDTFISDLVFGSAAGQFKAGAPCRGERVAKYNRLVEIEEGLVPGLPPSPRL